MCYCFGTPVLHCCTLVRIRSQTVCYWRIKWLAQVSSTDYDATVVLIGRLHNILRHDHVLKLLMSTYYKAMRLSMRSWNKMLSHTVKLFVVHKKYFSKLYVWLTAISFNCLALIGNRPKSDSTPSCTSVCLVFYVNRYIQRSWLLQSGACLLYVLTNALQIVVFRMPSLVYFMASYIFLIAEFMHYIICYKSAFRWFVLVI